MPFYIVKKEMYNLDVEAIVNSSSSTPFIGSEIDAQINLADGSALFEERIDKGLIPIGQAVITKGYQLKAKYVIHTAGPRYIDGTQKEEKFLYQTYINCLELAKSNNIQSIAFPNISSGNLGFPKELALEIAIKAIKSFLETNEIEVYLALYETKKISLPKELYLPVFRYIKRYRYLEDDSDFKYSAHNYRMNAMYDSISSERSLSDVVDEIDETFTEKLFRFIKEKNMLDTEVYKRANMTRQHFSKIRSDNDYQPKKETVIGLAIALKLNVDETEDLLNAAGFTLSLSRKFDLIIRYHIEHHIYDIDDINLILYSFDQKIIGSF